MFHRITELTYCNTWPIKVSMNELRIQRLQILSKFLDSRFQGPFGFRFGFDGIIGLIPFFGDIFTASVAFYIVFQAAVIGCPPSVLLRMVINIVIDNIANFIPFFGNIFDFIWKSNSRNIQLIQDFNRSPSKTTWQSRAFIGLILIMLIIVLSLMFLLSWMILQGLWNLGVFLIQQGNLFL